MQNVKREYADTVNRLS